MILFRAKQISCKKCESSLLTNPSDVVPLLSLYGQYLETYLYSSPFYLIPALLQHNQIPCKTCRLTGNIHHRIHTIINYLLKCLRIDSISWRIKNYKIWFILNIIKCIKYIVCYEFTVIKSIYTCIYFSCINCLGYYFNTYNFFATGAKICAIVPVPL